MAITLEKIEKTLQEVQEFVAACEALRLAVGEAKKSGWGNSCPKQTAAVRRHSMNLTRSLADLRRA